MSERVNGVLRVQERDGKTGVRYGATYDAFKISADTLLARSLWPLWFVEYVRNTAADLVSGSVYVRFKTANTEVVAAYDGDAFQRKFELAPAEPSYSWIAPTCPAHLGCSLCLVVMPSTTKAPDLTLALSTPSKEVGRLRLNRAAVGELRDVLQKWLRERDS